VAAYIRGARANGMLTTAKHFPGHGNTATDSHVGVPVVTDDLDHLRAVDLPPFQKAIGAGVDAVMTAHVRVLALDPDPGRVATTSPAIMTGLLKNQLGFKGIVVTDALDMAGLVGLYAKNPGRVAVDAFQGGKRCAHGALQSRCMLPGNAGRCPLGRDRTRSAGRIRPQNPASQGLARSRGKVAWWM